MKSTFHGLKATDHQRGMQTGSWEFLVHREDNNSSKREHTNGSQVTMGNTDIGFFNISYTAINPLKIPFLFEVLMQ
jgi:hypothetical protein